MKNLKSVTILITAGLSLTLFGCSNTAVSGKDETTATLRIAVDSKYEPFIAEIAPEFEATHNVKVEFTGQDSFTAMDSLALDGPAGLAADVLMIPHDRIGSLAKMGMIQPIDITDVSSDFDQVAIDAVTFENQSYGLPAAIEVLMLMYNKDLLPEAPQTFAELEALTTQEEYKFANEPGRSTAFLAKFVDFYLAYSVLGGYGAEVFAEKNTDTTTVQLNNQGGIDGLDYIKSWLETFPIGLQDEQSAGDFITRYFQEGKTAAIIDGPWNVSNYLDAGVNLGLAPLPTLPNGSKPTPFAGIKTWAVTAFASDKELATAWTKYVTNEANAAKFYDTTQEITPSITNLDYVNASDNQLGQVIVEQFATAVATPNMPEMAEVWEFKSAIFAVASGTSAKKAADDAALLIEDNIQMKHGE